LEAAYVGNPSFFFPFLCKETLCENFSLLLYIPFLLTMHLPLPTNYLHFLSRNWDEAYSKKVHPKAQEMELNCWYTKIMLLRNS